MGLREKLLYKCKLPHKKWVADNYGEAYRDASAGGFRGIWSCDLHWKTRRDIATGYPIIEFFLTVCGVALFDRNGGSLAPDSWLKVRRNNHNPQLKKERNCTASKWPKIKSAPHRHMNDNH